MGLLLYLVFFLLPFSFGFPNQNSKMKSERNNLSSDHSFLPTSKPILDFGCVQNEHFSFCYGHCQHNCSNWGLPLSCSKNCFPGCICDDGYVRGPGNGCVLVKECSSEENKETFNADDAITRNSTVEEEKEGEDFCPPNEIFSPCLAHCQKNCNNWSDLTVSCLKICVPGCICDNGLVRSHYGNCIQPRKCLLSNTFHHVPGVTFTDCPTDEHFDECKAHCQKNCSNWDQETKCRRICVPGCVCDKGFVRSSSGKCVLAEKCSSLNQNPMISIKTEESSNSCPEGEQRSNLKPFQNSDVYCISETNTIVVCSPTYLKGCVCKKGQIRGDGLHCIDHRLMPHVNEIHFILSDKRNPDSPEINLKLEPTKELSALRESTEKSTLSSSEVQDREINLQRNAGDGISLTTVQQISVTASTTKHSLLYNDPNSLKYHGCPNRQKCFEWCQVEGFLKGTCMGTRKLDCVCFYF